MGKLKVLFASSEVVPFTKTGGLADVSGSLPIALAAQGADVRVITPKYRTAKVGGDSGTIGDGVRVWFVENEDYFDRKELYGDRYGDYSDNLDRFSFFCRQALERCIKEGFAPDLIHCNDWQTALIPVYLNTIYKYDKFFERTKTLFTVHNIASQGLFAKEEFPKMGLDWALFHIHYFEFYGQINVMKAGIVYSDAVSTVSPTFAEEILTKEYGCGLEGVFKTREDVLYGILNGIDYNVWNPAADKKLLKNYSADTIDDKYINKEALQKELGLKVDYKIPMIGMVSRLADQKGMDLVARVLGDILNKKVQLVILGVGEQRYHVLLEKMAKAHPKNASMNLAFDHALADRIYAGCDMLLMPSRYEPCGLSQMIGFKYGTVPVARRTGGLKDSVFEFDANTKVGTGFTFSDYKPEAFFGAIRKALTAYQNRDVWRALVKKDMALDFSWKASAKEYMKLYGSFERKEEPVNG